MKYTVILPKISSVSQLCKYLKSHGSVLKFYQKIQIQMFKDKLWYSTESHFDSWELEVFVMTSSVVHECQEFQT